MKGTNSPPRIAPAYALCSPETETEVDHAGLYIDSRCLCRGLIKIFFFPKRSYFSLIISSVYYIIFHKKNSLKI